MALSTAVAHVGGDGEAIRYFSSWKFNCKQHEKSEMFNIGVSVVISLSSHFSSKCRAGKVASFCQKKPQLS